MTAYREKTLDANAAKIKPTIYEVDGLRGTLKELADYFKVDPIEVSDMLIAGISMEDALCKASSIKVPGGKRKSAGKEKMKVRLGKKKVVKTPAGRMKKVASEKPIVESVVEEMVVPVEKKTSVKKVPVKELVEVKVPATDQVSAFTTTDVKDLGDLIIVTTTTTTVYRKGV